MNLKRTAVIVVAAAMLATGCGSGQAPELTSPVALKDVGPGLKQVTLTDLAVQRLGIAVAEVSAVPASAGATAGRRAGAARLSIPYAAVIYADDGTTWTYTRLAPNSYLRAAITISAIERDVALLSSGPAAGTPVVVVGAPELLGAEREISGEE